MRSNHRNGKGLARLESGDESPHSKDASRHRSKPEGDALQRRFASQEQAQRRRSPKTLRGAGDARASAWLCLQLSTDAAAPRGGSALRTGHSKALCFFERPHAPPSGTAASRSAFADLTFRFAPDPRLRGPAPSDQRSSRAGLRPASCRRRRRYAAYFIFFIF